MGGGKEKGEAGAGRHPVGHAAAAPHDAQHHPPPASPSSKLLVAWSSRHSRWPTCTTRMGYELRISYHTCTVFMVHGLERYTPTPVGGFSGRLPRGSDTRATAAWPSSRHSSRAVPSDVLIRFLSICSRRPRGLIAQHNLTGRAAEPCPPLGGQRNAAL